MMSNNKILTVSYGTFSCTLEGFDDSFGTMKAIAEYFRDLAADDRYFGAEPPQPDAEMLARIAEREVSRRVEAREHEGRIMLKAHAAEAPQPEQDAAPTPVAATAPAKSAAAVAVLPAAPANYWAPEVEDDMAAVPAPEPETADFASDSEEAEVAEVAEVAASDDVDEQESMQSFFADSGELEISSEEEIEDEDATMTFAPFDTETDAPETTAARDEESIADKLQRIRAVVSRQDEADADYEDEEEDETATGAFEMPAVAKASSDPAKDSAIERELTEAAQDIEEALDADAAALDRNAEIESEEDELDAILSRIEAEEGDAEDNSLFAQADDYDEPEEEADNESLGNLFEDEDDAETGKAPVHARALKVNRADLQAALDQGELEDLSALEETHTSAIQPEAHKHAARDSLPDIDASAEKDVSRLMAEADHQMQEPEGRTRRSAFAHLRAAVAARFADRSMEKDAVAEKEEADAYRSDLAEAVKPRRPVAAVVKSERPAEARPVPLTLVAEQRIDAEAIKSNGGVSPRRVAASEDEYSTDGDTGFVEFAEEMGAVDLPELLEAAAAYLSFVEGQEQFSRPQLMSRVRQAKKDDFSREDGLRSFGMLLRTGKIEKIKGGRFAASEEIGFKPDHRAAG